MITCNLKGGLGNMMFQIAAMKSFAKDNNSEVSFPNLENHLHLLNSEVHHNPKMNYSFDYLKIFKNLTFNQSNIKTQATIEVPFDYVKLKFKDNYNYSGFFQNENFFIHNREYILYIYEPSDLIMEHLTKTYSDILSTKTCAIHVRRGDYLKLQDVHIVQDLNYFKEAMSIINDINYYLIFSDDLEWCKQNFVGDKFVFIQEEKDYNELFLMSLCKNQIISNSSFSWWGAWLNKNPNKIVIGPKKWFNNNSEWIKQEQINSENILPENWIKI